MDPQVKDPINGNDSVLNALGVNDKRGHEHFKYFFAFQDPRHTILSRSTHPNWKVEPFLKQALKALKEVVIPGENCAIDE